MKNRLYKFKNIDKHAIDILVNRRVYLSDWERLNDPHEARMTVQMPGNRFQMNPKGLKKHGFHIECADARVCCFSMSLRNNLLWSHYAGGHSGIAIELELPKNLSELERIEVKYDDIIPTVEPPINKTVVTKALSHKAIAWTYEKEIRVVSFDSDKKYIEGITITGVIFGLKTTQDDKDLIKSILKKDSISFSEIIQKAGFYKLQTRS